MGYNKMDRGEVIKAAIKADIDREVRERARDACRGIAKRDEDLEALSQLDDAQTVSDPASSWTPTGRLRWYRQDVVVPGGIGHDTVLQQEWVHMDGETSWGNVPVTVAEQGEENERG